MSENQIEKSTVSVVSNTEPILELKNVIKKYGKKIAVNNANLKVYRGRIVGLLGPNASGKTTIIKMISGLLTPTYGEILIDGNKPGPKSKSIVSYLPEQTYLAEEMRAVDAIKFFCDFYVDFDKERAYDMLSRLKIDTKTIFKTMSKGTKEKIQLILVMSRRAKLYLLDEPIAGVDPAARDYILSTIISNYSPESTIIISTHLITDVEKVLDDVVFIKDSEITFTSSVDEIRSQFGQSVDEYFREVFKC